MYFSEICRLKDTCHELKPCKRGSCVNDESRFELYRCECPPGFEGAQCQHEINECLTADKAVSCKNNGTCIDEFLGFSCQCQAGFIGKSNFFSNVALFISRSINESLIPDPEM